MEIAVLIFIGCAAWFGYHVYRGYAGTDQVSNDRANRSTTAGATTADQQPAREWTSAEIEALPIKVLTNPQWSCLYDATEGAVMIQSASNGSGGRFIDARQHHGKTVNVLVKHGLLQAIDGKTFKITDAGSCALDCLGVR